MSIDDCSKMLDAFASVGADRFALRARAGTLVRRSEAAQIQTAALQATSDEDLDCLESFVAGGAGLASCSATEKAVPERYEAEIEAAKGSLWRRSLHRLRR